MPANINFPEFIRNFAGADDNFPLQVARGRIPGMSLVSFDGDIGGLQTTDPPATVWNGPTLQYNFSTTAAIDTISSSSVSDVGIPVLITGLDINWLPIVQIAVLNGQNKVVLATSMFRVNIFITISTTTMMLGDVYMYEDTTITGGVPDVDANVRAKIALSPNTTSKGTLSQLVYSVQAGTTFYLKQTSIGGSRTIGTTNIEVAFQLVTITEGLVERNSSPLVINTQGTSNAVLDTAFPIPIPQRTDVLLRIVSVSANNASGIANMQGCLVDEALTEGL